MSNSVAFAIPLSTIEEAKEEQHQKETEQLVGGGEDEEDESVVFWPPTSSTLAFRLLLLALAALLPFGAHTTKYELGPLGPLLTSDPSLQLSHTEFDALQSAISIPNLFFPIMAGLWLDYRGSKTPTLSCLFLTLFSHVAFIFSLITQSFASAFFFHILFGAGQGGSVVATARITSRYFLGHELVMAIALVEASHNLATFLANGTTLPIAEGFGSYLYSLWFGAGYCLLSLLIGVVLFWLVRHELDSGKDSDEHVQKLLEAIPAIRRASGTGSVATKGRRQSSRIAIPPKNNRQEWTILGVQFFLVAFIHVLYGSCAHMFSFLLKNSLIFTNWHYSLSPGALLASMAAGSAVLLCPIVGYILDKKGQKIYLVAGASALTALAYITFALIDPRAGSTTVAVTALVVLAIGSSLVPTVLRASVAHVAPSALLGSAFGLYQMAEAIGTVVSHYFSVYFRDHGIPYQVNLWIFASLAVLGAVLAVVLSIFDARRQGVLNKPSIEKDATDEAEEEKARALADLEEAEERERLAKEDAARNSTLYELARQRAAAIFAKHGDKASTGNGASAAAAANDEEKDENTENAPLLLKVDSVDSTASAAGLSGYGATGGSASSGKLPTTLSGGGSARASLSIPQMHEPLHERSTSWTLEIANQKPKLYPRRRSSWMKSQTIPYLAVKRKPSISPGPSPTAHLAAAGIKETQK